MSGIRDLKWSALEDQGHCLLEKNVVTIPYCVFKLAAKARQRTLVEKCMAQDLEFLVDTVDKSLYVTEPWQQWESFGAFFFALRVNSIILLDNDNGARVRFSDLCQHAVINGCNQLVDLVPMEVVRISETLSPGIPELVTAMPSRQRINWVRGDQRSDTSGETVTYCLLNGSSGEGVDIFCALRLSVSDKLLFYADQRKRMATTLGHPTADNGFLKNAAIIPSCLGEEPDFVLGLFSLLSSYRHTASSLGPDSFVLSYEQHKHFHGCLASHPAASPCVDVNSDNISSLRLLTSVAPIANEIMSGRPFDDLASFSAFCEKLGHALSNEDRARCIV